jgi:hypothetical protein
LDGDVCSPQAVVQFGTALKTTLPDSSSSDLIALCFDESAQLKTLLTKAYLLIILEMGKCLKIRSQ